MQLSPISTVNAIQAANPTADTVWPAAASISGSAPAFASLIKDAVSSVHALEDKASSTVEGLISGTGVDIHEAMIATQKANMAFEIALSVRNKAVAAYQQLMQTQF
jgi:flagellar hook-basal body complex protein FliE